jgi:hypothetical protein
MYLLALGLGLSLVQVSGNAVRCNTKVVSRPGNPACVSAAQSLVPGALTSLMAFAAVRQGDTRQQRCSGRSLTQQLRSTTV